MHRASQVYKRRGAHSLKARICAALLLLVLAALPSAPVFANETDAEVPPESAPETIVEQENEEAQAVAEDISQPEEVPSADDESTNESSEPAETLAEEKASTTDGVSTDMVESDEVSDATSSSTPEAEAESDATESDVVTEVPTASSTQSTTTAPAATTTAGQGSTATTSVETAATSTATTSDTNLEEPLPETPVLDETPEFPEQQTETDMAANDEVLEETSTTTEIVEQTNAIATVVNDENRFSFAKTECVDIGDGSYFCTNVTQSQVLTKAANVFSEADADGDKEIFITTDQETIQLTKNNTDDDAPYYDDASKTIVWHRLVDGRYQIMSYGLKDKEEQQLTDGRQNNMQPTRYGDVVVWQSWIGDDWDIVLQVGEDRLVLTDNDVHDISPSINGDYIIWQSFEDDKWLVKVYDRRTDITETIEDSEGGSVENPRFVLVYDTKFGNGDVTTKGYDLRSKETVPLSAQPAPVPQEIPDPEQTGETRALVAPSVNLKSKSNSDGLTDDPLDDDTDATSTPEVIVTPFVPDTSSTTTQTIDDTTATATPAVLAEDDEITDVIVTPFVEKIEAASPTDPQSTVATST